MLKHKPAPPSNHYPNHLQLPESDGTFVKNFQEHPQSILLTDSILPVLQARHPDGHFAIGQDSGIYWRLTEPAERGAISPDWYYVPNVPPTLDGQARCSYVLWQEFVAPLVILEFVSGNGREERDQTPYPIAPLDVEVGIWQGSYQGMELPWLRWWDADGNLLLMGSEQVEKERQQTEKERQRAEHLAAQLRALGIEPDEG